MKAGDGCPCPASFGWVALLATPSGARRSLFLFSFWVVFPPGFFSFFPCEDDGVEHPGFHLDYTAQLTDYSERVQELGTLDYTFSKMDLCCG
jgi:hypothetical protein